MITDLSYFPHKGVGQIQFDPLQGTKHYDPWWMLLVTDQEIIRFYAWLLKRDGKPVWLSTLWGAHISVVKGQEPPDKKLWGLQYHEIEFRYSNIIRTDNDKHAWVDVYCPEASTIRQILGLPAKDYYHLTIGRLI